MGTLRGWSRYRPIAIFAGLYLAMGLLLRLTLCAVFGPHAHVAAADIAWVLPAGVLSDAVESLYLLVPFSLYALLVPASAYATPTNRLIVLVGAFLTALTVFYILPIEF